ncbi:hypothetical protein Tco_0813137 [Tanacetum coccineum]
MKTKPVSDPTSKLDQRAFELKSKQKKQRKRTPPLEKQKRIRNAWTQDEELAFFGESSSSFRDQKPGVIKSIEILFGTKSQSVQTKRRKKAPERTKNMLTGGENDDDHMSRVYTLYDATVGGEFKHQSAWLYFERANTSGQTPILTLQRSKSSFLRTDITGAIEMMICLDHNRFATASEKSTVTVFLTRPLAPFQTRCRVIKNSMRNNVGVRRKSQNDRSRERSEDRRAVDPNLKGMRRTFCLQIDHIRRDGCGPDASYHPNRQKARIRAAYPPPTN